MAHRDGIILITAGGLIPHSYAVVNQFQCLELLKRPGIKLYMHDAPYFGAWEAQSGLMSVESEAAIRSIGPLPAGVTPDVELRITFPYDLTTPPRAKRTCVFGTAEFGTVPNHFLAGNAALAEAHRAAPELMLITPSNWSRDGFLRSGADPSRLVVIPHGVDPDLFRPATAEQKLETRAKLGLNPADDEFIFLNLGAMSGNKGLPLLLKAFARVLQVHPKARLVMKGLDALYTSKASMGQLLSGLSKDDLNLISPRLNYVGQSLTNDDMVRLYQMADCYPSPYHAEGFNMPVMEAAACGLPVICTAGGSTDDFTASDFALRIPSKLRPLPPEPGAPEGRAMMPDPQELLNHMLYVIKNAHYRETARAAGPAFMRERFTWKHVVDRLLQVLLPV